MSSSYDDGSEQSDLESEYEYDSTGGDDGHYPEEDECHPSSLFNQEPISCPICQEDRVEEGLALTLPSCVHSFCVDCFTGYLNAEIGRGNADYITCPFILEDGGVTRQCRAPVGPDILREIMAQDLYDRLLKLKDAAFVRKNPDYHHCPTPDCSNIVLCKSIDNNNRDNGGRICDCFKCGHTSCLTCGASPFHVKKSCDEHRREKDEAEMRAQERERLLQQELQRGSGYRRPDRSRADEEVKFDFNIEFNGKGDVGDSGDNSNDIAENLGDALANIKRCRRCGNGVELLAGCLKMKCICGYRFCYWCGSENAQCDCTPSHHGFTDNITGAGDFFGLMEAKSYT